MAFGALAMPHFFDEAASSKGETVSQLLLRNCVSGEILERKTFAKWGGDVYVYVDS